LPFVVLKSYVKPIPLAAQHEQLLFSHHFPKANFPNTNTSELVTSVLAKIIVAHHILPNFHCKAIIKHENHHETTFWLAL
jgi:hypothetical protein